jgi:peptidoglycan/xylan/chitin deacetylase (PgdA/CDA1 family)
MVIVIMVMTFLLLPTLICIFMLFKMNDMQKQIDSMKVLQVTRIDLSSNSLLPIVKNIAESISEDSLFNLQDQANQFSTDLTETQVKNKHSKETLYLAKNQVLSKHKESNKSYSHNMKSVKSEDKPEPKKEKSDEEQTRKRVYLTFDDGPSKYTSDLLDLLAKYRKKATFFVIGKTDEYSLQMYKRIVDEGHTLGMHSFSHDYDLIYNSLKDFEKDFKKIQTLLEETTGVEVNMYRFPGGSGIDYCKDNISEFIDFLDRNEVSYYDWNVISGDATGEELTSQMMCDNVLSGIEANNTSIVLIHDTNSKIHTIDTLEKILKSLKDQSIELLPLSGNSPTFQQVK